MDEITLYENILQLQRPWFVESVDLDESTGSINVYVGTHEGIELACPKCGQRAPGYDTRTRRWRHLDTCQYQTYVVANVPRVNCVEHGPTTIDVSWAEQRSRFTQMFESQVIDWLLEASVSAVSRRLALSWNAIDGIMQRAVRRGLVRRQQDPPTHICVDETSFKKYHNYVTVVSNQQGHVIDVQDDCKKSSLKRFYDQLTPGEKDAIVSISMDMSPAYVACTLEQIPNARRKIAFDRFHVSMYLNKAVDEVRKAERKNLSASINQRLKGKRYLWLYNPENLTTEQVTELRKLNKIATKIGRAWAIKEYAATLWDYVSETWARKGWLSWYNWAIRSQLTPIKTAARMVKDNLWGIVNAIIHKVNNGMAESINSKIKSLKIKSRGFRNKERFKTAILFHYGGLNLHP